MPKMMDILLERKREIREAFEVEMAEVDLMISTLQAHAAKASGDDHNSDNLALLTIPPNKMPINEAIIKAIENGQGTPIGIYKFISDNFLIVTTMNSINTRLSKLKSAGKISHNGKYWKPASKSSKQLELENLTRN